MKKLISLFTAAAAALMCCACNSETQYVNQGGDRQVTQSSQVSSIAETDNSGAAEGIPILDQWDKNKYHTFESDITVLSENNKEETKHLKIEYATNNDIKVLVSNKDGGYYGYVYQNSTHNFYKLSSEYKDKAWKILSLNGLSSIFTNIKNIIIVTCLNYDVLRFSEDDRMALAVSNDTLVELNKELNNAIFSYYDDIYKATKNDQAFKDFVTSWIGNYYDLSLGISKNALRGLLNQIEYKIRQNLQNQEKYKKVSVIIDPSENCQAEFEISSYDPDTQDVSKVVTGALKITGEPPESITLPETIVAEDPLKEDPEITDSSIDDETPDYSEPAPPVQTDDSSISSGNDIDEWF